MVNAESTVIGACQVIRKTDPNTGTTFFEVRCPTGMAQVFRDRVYIYGPWERSARAYFDKYVYQGVEGRVRAVEPIEEPLAQSFEDLGLRIGAEEPHELYEAIEEKLGGRRRRFLFF
jgi:hypothetical protein